MRGRLSSNQREQTMKKSISVFVLPIFLTAGVAVASFLGLVGLFSADSPPPAQPPSALTLPPPTATVEAESTSIPEEVITSTSTPTEQMESAEPEQPTTQTYIVQTGETLSELAVRFSTDTETLIELNGLSDGDAIQADQELIVPVTE